MDEQDFVGFEGFLRDQLDRAGLADLLDERLYLDQTGESRVSRLPSDRVIDILLGLERFLSLYDRGIYQGAMRAIAGLLEEANQKSGEPVNIPEEAVVSFSANSAAGPSEVSLSRLNDLSGARESLKKLILDLRGE